MKPRLVSTSKQEIRVYYFAKKFFPNAKNRYHIKDSNGKNLEMDVYIPDVNAAVEYDGYVWHKDKYDMDAAKTRKLNAMGIKVVHIRDIGLKELPDFDGIEIWHKAEEDGEGMHTNECITAMINYLGSLCEDEETRNKLMTYELSYEEYLAHGPAISPFIYGGDPNSSPITPWVSDYWDAEKNGKFDLEKILNNPDEESYLRCPSGKSKLVKILPLIRAVKEKNEMLADICPFLMRSNVCIFPCDYFYNELRVAIDKLLTGTIKIPRQPKEIHIFYRYLEYVARNENLIVYYVKKMLNGEIPYAQFEKVLMPHRCFLQHCRLSVSKPETFELLKEFQNKYMVDERFGEPSIGTLSFILPSCDIDHASRTAFFDYVRWVIEDPRVSWKEDYVNHLFLGLIDISVSDEMLTMLKDLSNDYPEISLKDQIRRLLK